MRGPDGLSPSELTERGERRPEELPVSPAASGNHQL